MIRLIFGQHQDAKNAEIIKTYIQAATEYVIEMGLPDVSRAAITKPFGFWYNEVLESAKPGQDLLDAYNSGKLTRSGANRMYEELTHHLIERSGFSDAQMELLLAQLSYRQQPLGLHMEHPPIQAAEEKFRFQVMDYKALDAVLKGDVDGLLSAQLQAVQHFANENEFRDRAMAEQFRAMDGDKKVVLHYRGSAHVPLVKFCQDVGLSVDAVNTVYEEDYGLPKVARMRYMARVGLGEKLSESDEKDILLKEAALNFTKILLKNSTDASVDRALRSMHKKLTPEQALRIVERMPELSIYDGFGAQVYAKLLEEAGLGEFLKVAKV